MIFIGRRVQAYLSYKNKTTSSFRENVNAINIICNVGFSYIVKVKVNDYFLLFEFQEYLYKKPISCCTKLQCVELKLI